MSSSNRKSVHSKIVFTVQALILALSVGATTGHAAESVKPSPLPIEQMRATAYTKAFAKRFALPDPRAGTEPQDGIQAMEFAVETSPNAPYYYCKLYLYFDNKLPIAYPEGETGVAHLPSRRTQLITFDGQARWLRLSEQDRSYFGERQSRYTRMSLIASPDYDYPENVKEPPKKPYGAVDMLYDEYNRNLFLGLAYLKIDMGCPSYSWVDKIETAQIWLKRENGKDYRKQVRMEPQDFIKFTLPSSFYRQVIQWSKQTAAYNRSLVKEHQRKTKDTAERR